MSNPQFTSGPWHVSENQPTVVGNKEKAVCKCELDWDLGAKERKANAALISAAPELYDMLQKILDEHVIPTYKAQMAQDVIRILKKARGEE